VVILSAKAISLMISKQRVLITICRIIFTISLTKMTFPKLFSYIALIEDGSDLRDSLSGYRLSLYIL
jgi:hypothetical protein